MPRHCVNTLRGIVKCRANSTTTAIIAVRQVKPFEVGREKSMLREEDNILSNPGPFPAYLKWFHLSDSDYCSCGGIGTALHYATE
ncbi:hypothetical protein AVEN_266721-1 [Araneus ventricosus]|uniref:Uncharacterized protein n=1 Tax=Araneus ventricosus TaxID=182803 RepID=A0A4Y2LJW1_ARAVE|nr:hypothetical protein AVEN_266721-1 [Araneus ventricosus]